MKRLLVLFVLLFTVLFSYTVVAQDFGSLKKGVEITFPEKIHKLILDPLPAGTYSIGTGGYFATIQSAFNKLSTDGIAGEVILELIDNLYIAPTGQFGFFLNGPLPGAGPTSRVTIKPAANKNVTIEGSNEEVIFCLNTSYVTLDGVGLTGATTLTVHAIFDAQFEWNDCVDFMNNSDHNVVQNTIFVCDDIFRWGGGANFWNLFIGSDESPDSNFIQNNFFKIANLAIGVGGNNSPVKAIGNIIRGNIVGSETDSLIALGIYTFYTQGTVIENNIVQNLKVVRESMVRGIDVYDGYDDIIRNNVIYNIKSDAGYSSVGILLSGSAGEAGSNNQVYNNMVYDIQSTSTYFDNRVTGIQMWHQNNPKIYYNSVYLSGTGANQQGSAALFINNNCTNVEAKNNIFVNTRDESPYCASVIYDFSASNLTSDYNDLYYEPNQFNCMVTANNINYLTLSDWQATGQDLNSITEMPNFKDPYLHINETFGTYLESGATPIVGIDSDFDGELRNVSTPDIGADEFSGFTPVELTSFTASANGKEVILNWSTATELNNLGFEIQRSTEGEEFFTVGFVNGHGTTTESQNYSYADRNLDDGKYYYRLKQVDYDGSYEYSDVVEVEWRSFNSYLLEQNFPNPFNPSTNIKYAISSRQFVLLKVYDILGNEIATLMDEEKSVGTYKLTWNAGNLPSGVYFYQLKAGDFVQTKKMLLLK